MKKLLTALLVLTSTTLSACQKIKSDNVMFSLNTAEEQLIEINAQTLEYMIKNEFNLNVLCYTQYCSYCEKALDSAYEEQNRIDCLIYKIEMNQANTEYLINNLPDIFDAKNIYPSMYLFKEGKLSYTIDYNKLQNYKSLHRVLYPQLYSSKMIMMYSEDRFGYALNEATTALVYTYDSSRADSNGELVKKIIDVSTKESDYYTVLIDKNVAETGLISKFYNYTGFNDDGSFDYLSIIEHGQIKTTVRYLSDDGSQVDNLLKSIL